MRYPILLLITFTGFLCVAQESEDYAKYKKNLNFRDGYIIDKGGQVMYGLVKDQNEKKIAYQVVFVDKAGVKKKYKPSQIRGYGVSVYKYVSNSKIFLEILSEGKRISIYKAITTNRKMTLLLGNNQVQSKSTVTQSENYYFKKSNEIKFQKFKTIELSTIYLGKLKKVDKKLVEYFSDCESLKTRIASGELTSNDYNKIAYHYNYDCQ